MKTQLRIVGVVIALGLATPAGAQIYAPPPALQGQPSYHLWSVPGVINNGLATVFSCTNTTSANVTVGVEVFDRPGGASLNDASATSLVLGPGATASFGTQSVNGFISISNNLGLGLVFGGSARVLATAVNGLPCTAILTDPSGSPPGSMTNLTLTRHTNPMMAAVCGLGSELALVLPPLFWLRARRRGRA